MNYQISQEHRNAIIQAVSNSVMPTRDGLAIVQILQNLNPAIEEQVKDALKKTPEQTKK